MRALAISWCELCAPDAHFSTEILLDRLDGLRRRAVRERP